MMVFKKKAVSAAVFAVMTASMCLPSAAGVVSHAASTRYYLDEIAGLPYAESHSADRSGRFITYGSGAKDVLTARYEDGGLRSSFTMPDEEQCVTIKLYGGAEAVFEKASDGTLHLESYDAHFDTIDRTQFLQLADSALTTGSVYPCAVYLPLLKAEDKDLDAILADKDCSFVFYEDEHEVCRMPVTSVNGDVISLDGVDLSEHGYYMTIEKNSVVLRCYFYDTNYADRADFRFINAGENLPLNDDGDRTYRIRLSQENFPGEMSAANIYRNGEKVKTVSKSHFLNYEDDDEDFNSFFVEAGTENEYTIKFFYGWKDEDDSEDGVSVYKLHGSVPYSIGSTAVRGHHASFIPVENAAEGDRFLMVGISEDEGFVYEGETVEACLGFDGRDASNTSIDRGYIGVTLPEDGRYALWKLDDDDNTVGEPFTLILDVDNDTDTIVGVNISDEVFGSNVVSAVCSDKYVFDLKNKRWTHGIRRGETDYIWTTGLTHGTGGSLADANGFYVRSLNYIPDYINAEEQEDTPAELTLRVYDTTHSLFFSGTVADGALDSYSDFYGMMFADGSTVTKDALNEVFASNKDLLEMDKMYLYYDLISSGRTNGQLRGVYEKGMMYMEPDKTFVTKYPTESGVVQNAYLASECRIADTAAGFYYDKQTDGTAVWTNGLRQYDALSGDTDSTFKTEVPAQYTLIAWTETAEPAKNILYGKTSFYKSVFGLSNGSLSNYELSSVSRTVLTAPTIFDFSQTNLPEEMLSEKIHYRLVDLYYSHTYEEGILRFYPDGRAYDRYITKSGYFDTAFEDKPFSLAKYQDEETSKRERFWAEDSDVSAALDTQDETVPAFAARIIIPEDHVTVSAGEENGIVKTYDVNKDGDISVTDAAKLQRYLVGKDVIGYSDYLNADANGDGVVNIYDQLLLKRQLLKQ